MLYRLSYVGGAQPKILKARRSQVGDRERGGEGRRAVEGTVSLTADARKSAYLPQRLNVAVEKLLNAARARLKRLTPEQASAEHARGALLVDIRTAEQRSRGGRIPGALLIDRTVLEWRLDPSSPARVPEAAHTGVRVIVVCEEGYSSSLAAASLLDMGLTNATDVIGGFEAWEAAGLPVER